MLDEYRAQAQQAIDQIEETHLLLDELVRTLAADYPETERTFRMGKAMEELAAVNALVVQAGNRLHGIEWPTVDQPR